MQHSKKALEAETRKAEAKMLRQRLVGVLSNPQSTKEQKLEANRVLKMINGVMSAKRVQ